MKAVACAERHCAGRRHDAADVEIPVRISAFHVESAGVLKSTTSSELGPWLMIRRQVSVPQQSRWNNGSSALRAQPEFYTTQWFWTSTTGRCVQQTYSTRRRILISLMLINTLSGPAGAHEPCSASGHSPMQDAGRGVEGVASIDQEIAARAKT